MTQYIIQSLVGAAGGWLGSKLKANGLGDIGNAVAGLVGGNVATMGLGAVASSMMMNGDGSNNMIASIASSLIGGGAASMLGGLIKK